MVAGTELTGLEDQDVVVKAITAGTIIIALFHILDLNIEFLCQ